MPRRHPKNLKLGNNVLVKKKQQFLKAECEASAHGSDVNAPAVPLLAFFSCLETYRIVHPLRDLLEDHTQARASLAPSRSRLPTVAVPHHVARTYARRRQEATTDVVTDSSGLRYSIFRKKKCSVFAIVSKKNMFQECLY